MRSINVEETLADRLPCSSIFMNVFLKNVFYLVRFYLLMPNIIF